MPDDQGDALSNPVRAPGEVMWWNLPTVTDDGRAVRPPWRR